VAPHKRHCRCRADSAQGFYSGLTGWTYSDSGQEGNDYRLFAADGPAVGGLLALTQPMIDNGAVPMWAGYICVVDIDKAAADVKAARGQVLLEPWEIPDVGRIALVTDPQGAAFYLSQTNTDYKSDSYVGEVQTIGHCGWNELCTSDPEDAERFYGNLFGWTHADSIDMGPAGTYKLYANGADSGSLIGGMMLKPDEFPVSMWSHYFRVGNIDTAAAYVKDNGGSVMMEPMEVPGGEWVFAGMDPQEAMFSVIGPR